MDQERNADQDKTICVSLSVTSGISVAEYSWWLFLSMEIRDTAIVSPYGNYLT